MGQHIQNLIVALVRRMQSASIEGLRSSLLLIFARLVLCLCFNFILINLIPCQLLCSVWEYGFQNLDLDFIYVNGKNRMHIL